MSEKHFEDIWNEAEEVSHLELKSFEERLISLKVLFSGLKTIEDKKKLNPNLTDQDLNDRALLLGSVLFNVAAITETENIAAALQTIIEEKKTDLLDPDE